jgi:hypothetical protein
MLLLVLAHVLRLGVHRVGIGSVVSGNGVSGLVLVSDNAASGVVVAWLAAIGRLVAAHGLGRDRKLRDRGVLQGTHGRRLSGASLHAGGSRWFCWGARFGTARHRHVHVVHHLLELLDFILQGRGLLVLECHDAEDVVLDETNEFADLSCDKLALTQNVAAEVFQRGEASLVILGIGFEHGQCFRLLGADRLHQLALMLLHDSNQVGNLFLKMVVGHHEVREDMASVRKNLWDVDGRAAVKVHHKSRRWSRSWNTHLRNRYESRAVGGNSVFSRLRQLVSRASLAVATVEWARDSTGVVGIITCLEVGLGRRDVCPQCGESRVNRVRESDLTSGRWLAHVDASDGGLVDNLVIARLHFEYQVCRGRSDVYFACASFEDEGVKRATAGCGTWWGVGRWRDVEDQVVLVELNLCQW